MGGYNPRESLTQRVYDYICRPHVSQELRDLLKEVLCVLEGRLMIDAKGMVREPEPGAIIAGSARFMHRVRNLEAVAKLAGDLCDAVDDHRPPGAILKELRPAVDLVVKRSM